MEHAFQAKQRSFADFLPCSTNGFCQQIMNGFQKTVEQFISKSPQLLQVINAICLYADIPENTGYIVSEISATVYGNVSSEVFLLGDHDETMGSNDFPERYVNGPLEEGTRYSVFVWGFIPAIQNSSVSWIFIICSLIYLSLSSSSSPSPPPSPPPLTWTGGSSKKTNSGRKAVQSLHLQLLLPAYFHCH